MKVLHVATDEGLVDLQPQLPAQRRGCRLCLVDRLPLAVQPRHQRGGGERQRVIEEAGVGELPDGKPYRDTIPKSAKFVSGDMADLAGLHLRGERPRTDTHRATLDDMRRRRITLGDYV